MADPERDQYKIPTRGEHGRTVARIWKIFGAIGASAFLLMGGAVVVMKAMGYESKDIVSVQLIAVYIFVPIYGLGFVAPALATSLLKMGLAVEMSREGLDIGQKTAEVAEKIDTALDSRLKRVDGTLDTLDRLVKEVEKGEGPLLNVFKDEMAKLRAEIRSSRNEAERELADALDAGEREAGAPVQGPPCHHCEKPMTPITEDGAPTGQYMCVDCPPHD